MSLPLRFLLVALLMHTACFPAYAKQQIQQSEIVKHITLEPSTGISITGSMDVSLHTGYKKHPEIILYGKPRDLKQILVYRKGNLIQLVRKKKSHSGLVKAEIRSNVLRSFSYSGTGRITGNKIHAAPFNLFLNNKGTTTLRGSMNLRKLTVLDSGLTLLDGIKSDSLSVKLGGDSRAQLTGVANLTQLETEGKGWLGMYWVKSHALTVRSRDMTQVQLGGVVNFLDVELRDKALFKGRYLRADTAFVKTYDTSTAELTALKTQHTLALDKSDIHFYNISEFRTDFMGDDGAVLDMRAWNQYSLKDYNVYNK